MTAAASPEPWPRGRSRHGGIDRVPLPESVPGRLWLAGKRYVAPDPAGALDTVGADTVVCLCERFELEGHWPHYVAWLAGAGDRSIWRPIPDLGVPPIDEARTLVAGVASLLDAGRGVIVHCGAGIGRAGTTAVAVLLHYGEPLDRALETVAAARPGAGPQVDAQTHLLATLART